jgi:hypothetical protein
MVQVSARLQGRAKGGMADCIRSWVKAEANGLPHRVEDPVFALQRLLQPASDAIALPGEAMANIRATESVIAPDVSVDVAITRLKQMIAEHGTPSCHEKIGSGFLMRR